MPPLLDKMGCWVVVGMDVGVKSTSVGASVGNSVGGTVGRGLNEGGAVLGVLILFMPMSPGNRRSGRWRAACWPQQVWSASEARATKAMREAGDRRFIIGFFVGRFVVGGRQKHENKYFVSYRWCAEKCQQKIYCVTRLSDLRIIDEKNRSYRLCR
jgi:hypothetical protein